MEEGELFSPEPSARITSLGKGSLNNNTDLYGRHLECLKKVEQVEKRLCDSECG